MLKLKKKVFFTGLTLAILMPIVAQADNALLTKMEVGYCDQTNMLRGCNPATIVDTAAADHKTKIKPMLDASNPAFIGVCSRNALEAVWGKFEQIRQDSTYQAAMKNYQTSCVANLKKGQKAPVLPQAVIVANVIRNLGNKSHPQYIQFYGKIVGPDGKTLAGLFDDNKDLALKYNSEVLSKKSSSLDDDDDSDVSTVKDTACPDEKDFADGLVASDDDNSDSQVTKAAKRLSGEIDQLAHDCASPSDVVKGAPSLDKLSDTLSAPSLEQRIEGTSNAASGA